MSRPSPAWSTLALVSVPVFVGAIDLTVVSAVLPTVIADLRIPLQEGLDDASWAVSGYFLAYVLGIAVMGRASDVVGRRAAYLAALAVFFVGSALAAASSEIGPALGDAVTALAGGSTDRSFAALYAFVVARLIQGFGAGAMLPVGMAVVGDLFPVGRRTLPLGIVAGVDTAGWMLGHLYGGVLVQFLGWPWIFWLNLPIASVAFALIWRGLHDGPGRRAATFDWRGAAALAVALVALDLALSGSETGPSGLVVPDRAPAYAVPALVVSVLAGLLFVWLERRSRAPLLDAGLLRGGAGVATAINFLVGGCLIAALVSVPLLVNAAGARSSEAAALASGAVLATFTIPMAIAAVLGGRLARAGARGVTASGLALAAVGFIFLARVPPEAARQALAFVGALAGPERPGEIAELGAAAGALALSGVGFGLTVAPLSAVVIDASGLGLHGAAASLVIALRLLGMMVGTSLLTTYGVRRWATLAPSAFADIPLDQPRRLGDAAFALTAAIADEMVLLAASVALVAAALAFRLPSGPHGRGVLTR